MPDAVIVSACRTAIGTSRKGTLADTEATVLARAVVDESLAAHGHRPQGDRRPDPRPSPCTAAGSSPATWPSKPGSTNVPGLAQNRHCAVGLAAVQTGRRRSWPAWTAR